MISAAGSANRSFRARTPASTWPWGDTIGSVRVSSYSSRATRRTAGSGSKKRSASRTAATTLHDRRPARGVLPLPGIHRLLVARDATRRGVDAQRAPGRLRDVAEVAQQDALRAFRDRLMQRGARADRVQKILDVLRGHVVVGAEVEAVPPLGGERLLHGLALEIVDRVAVAVHHRAAARTENGGASAAVERLRAVAALPLPDDRLAVREVEAGFLRVGKLPVVFEVVAASRRGDADGVIHAQRPACDVDLVRAVVADLARPPAVEPMPVVVDHVVAIRRVRRRPLPQLVVQVGRDGRHFAAPNARAGVGVPSARQVWLADD